MIDVVDWIRAIRTRRDLLPIGVAGYLPDPVLRDVLMKELRIRPVLHLPAPPLYASEAVLNDLAQESIVPELLEEWARRFGSPTGDIQRIAQIIAEAGVNGDRKCPRNGDRKCPIRGWGDEPQVVDPSRRFLERLF